MVLVGWGRRFFDCYLAHLGSTGYFLLLQVSSGAVLHPRASQLPLVSVESSSKIHHETFHELFANNCPFQFRTSVVVLNVAFWFRFLYFFVARY